MSKLFASITIAIMMISISSPHFVFAQFPAIPGTTQQTDNTDTTDQTPTTSCSACGSTPAELQQYIDLATEVMSTFRSYNNNGAAPGSYTTPLGPRQAGTFNVTRTGSVSIISNLIKGATRNIGQKLSAITTTSILLLTMGKEAVLNESRFSLTMMGQSRPIMRDYMRISDLDAQIGDEMYELGIGGGYFKRMSPEAREAVQQILNRYTTTRIQSASDLSTSALFSQATVEEGTTYGQVMQRLVVMNRKYKRFLSNNTINGFVDGDPASNQGEEITKGNLKVTFSPTYARTLQSRYECVRGVSNQCQGAISDFKNNIKQITKGFAKDVKSSVEQIKTSLTNLKGLYGLLKQGEKGDGPLSSARDAYLKAERELLATAYGQDPIDPNDPITRVGPGGIKTQFGLTQLFRRTKLNSLAQPVTSATDQSKALKKQQAKDEKAQAKKDRRDFAATRQGVINASNDASNTEVVNEEVSFQNLNETSEKLEAMFTQNMNELIAQQQVTDQTLILTSPRDLTQQITNLINNVGVARNALSNTNHTDIFYNLGRACELQCSNLGGRCW